MSPILLIPSCLAYVSALNLASHAQLLSIWNNCDICWNRSFNDTNYFQKEQEGPIEEDTIVVLDGQTGQMLASWGGNFFYMPHGITIDQNNNLWLTDVALHQVFKVMLPK